MNFEQQTYVHVSADPNLYEPIYLPSQAWLHLGIYIHTSQYSE